MARDGDAVRRRELAEFLRTRRDRLTPDDVGIVAPGVRRLPGLRREEVADLAHLGTAWYTWLEQARDINVSDEVLYSIASALRLDADERAYLLTIGRSPRLGRQRFDDPPEVPAFQQAVLDAMYPHPAHIRDQYWNLLSWNRGFSAVTGIDGALVRRPNMLRLLFTDKTCADLQADWERTAAFAVSQFRFECARRLQDREVVVLLEELRDESPLFGDLWRRQEVHSGAGTRAAWREHKSGTLVFDRVVYAVPGMADPAMINGPRQRLGVYVPVAGTGTRERIREIWDADAKADALSA